MCRPKRYTSNSGRRRTCWKARQRSRSCPSMAALHRRQTRKCWLWPKAKHTQNTMLRCAVEQHRHSLSPLAISVHVSDCRGLYCHTRRAPHCALLWEVFTNRQQCTDYWTSAVQGRIIKGEASIKRSRYPEDVLINNHTSVWGSWWANGIWGYACCHQTTKNSFCTGEAGLEAEAQAAELMDANLAHKLQRPEPPAERSSSQVR